MLSTDSLVKMVKWSEGDQWEVRQRWCKRRVGGCYDQFKNMIFIMSRRINVLS